MFAPSYAEEDGCYFSNDDNNVVMYWVTDSCTSTIKFIVTWNVLQYGFFTSVIHIVMFVSPYGADGIRTRVQTS